MKLALLGTAESGKTVKMTALHHLSRTEPSVKGIAPDDLAEAKQRGATSLHSLRIQMEDSDLTTKLIADAKLLNKFPMQFPKPTDKLNQALMQAEFGFRSLNKTEDVREYTRPVELYDPAGGAIGGAHKESGYIKEQLASCDGAIVFLSSAHFLEVSDANNKDEIALLRAQLETSTIMGLLEKMRSRMPTSDIFPVCFVLSQADLIASTEAVDRVNKLLWNKILYPLSMDHPWLIMSYCRISVQDPATKRYATMNIEWPFLLSTMGIIYRNAVMMKRLADENAEQHRKTDQSAQEMKRLYDKNPFGYFCNFIGSRGNTFAKEGGKALEYLTESGRTMKLYQDDGALVKDIASRYAQEQEQSGQFLLMQGKYLKADELLERIWNV